MGWAAGFQAGTRLGEAILKGRQRQAYEDIQSQKAEGLQGYTVDDAAKLEELAKSGLYDIVPQYAEPTPQQRDPNLMNPVELERNMTQDPRGVFTGYRAVPKAEIAARAQDPQNRQYSGLAPRDINPSRVTDFLGQRYAGDLPEARQVGLRSRALAEATVDPIERQRLLSAAIKEERDAILAQREDELYPLKKRELELGLDSAETENKTKKLTLAEKERAAKEAENMTEFQAAVAALPPEQQNDSRTLMDLATKYKLTTKQQDQLIADRTNRSTNEITLARNEITKLVKGKSLDELSALHKTNDMLDPGRHFEVLRDNKGNVTLQMVDSTTGDPIGPPAFRGSEAEATKYLYTAATAPETLVEYAASLEKARLDAKKTQAQITKDEALGLAATRNAASNAANAASTETYRRSQGIKAFTNDAGDVVMIDVGRLPPKQGGLPGEVETPKGLRPVRENVEPSEAVVNKMAEMLFGQPIPGAGLDKDGKPIVYDAVSAYEEAYRRAYLSRNPGAQRKAPKSAADLLAEEIAAKAREDALRNSAGPRGGPGLQTNPASRTPTRLGMMPFTPSQDF